MSSPQSSVFVFVFFLIFLRDTHITRSSIPRQSFHVILHLGWVLFSFVLSCSPLVHNEVLGGWNSYLWKKISLKSIWLFFQGWWQMEKKEGYHTIWGIKYWAHKAWITFNSMGVLPKKIMKTSQRVSWA